MNTILGILGKNFENFWENFALIIIKLLQFKYNSLKFWVDFKKIFSKFEKTQMQKGSRKFLGSFFRRFSSIESIVMGYRYYPIHRGVDTIQSTEVLILSNPPRYQYYPIHRFIDTIQSTEVSILSNWYWYFCHHQS